MCLVGIYSALSAQDEVRNLTDRYLTNEWKLASKINPSDQKTRQIIFRFVAHFFAALDCDTPVELANNANRQFFSDFWFAKLQCW